MAFFCGTCSIPGCGKRIPIHPEDEGYLEKCCPAFWEDTGVPPVPILSWVFDPKNKYLNDNEYLDKFGNVGLKFFDYKRKVFMLIITFLTVMAMFVTAVGCAANSNDTTIIQYTNWGTAWYRNETTLTAYKFYMGLGNLVVMECEDARGDDTYEHKWYHKCKTIQNSYWGTLKKSHMEEDYGITGKAWTAFENCEAQAVKNQFGVIMTCVTMIFALMGCLTRMRKVADSNFQKTIGCIPDTIGVITLTITLVDFYTSCAALFPSHLNGMQVYWWQGPGYMTFVCCLVVTFFRVSVHYLTPTPGHGIEGACCVDESEVNAKLELTAQEKAQETNA